MRNLITKTTGMKRCMKAISLVCKTLAGVVTHGTGVASFARFLSSRMVGRFAPVYAPVVVHVHQAGRALPHQALRLADARRSWRPAGDGSARSGGEA